MRSTVGAKRGVAFDLDGVALCFLQITRRIFKSIRLARMAGHERHVADHERIGSAATGPAAQ